jgi:hypothetical protein
MEYHTGRLTVSPKDVVRFCSAMLRSFSRWIIVTRRTTPPPPGRSGLYSCLYAEHAAHELQVAWDLLGQNHIRAAGAIAGVALELYLRHVAAMHQVTIRKHVSIAQLQDSLRYVGLLDDRQRRQIQRLSSIRNQCVHGQKHAPSRAQVEWLILGVEDLRRTLH